MQKGSSAVLVLVCLLIVTGLGAASYYVARQKSQLTQPKPHGSPEKTSFSTTLSPSQNETANWKTYTYQELGFSFRYPPDWNISHQFCSSYGLICAKSSDLSLKPLDGSAYTFTRGALFGITFSQNSTKLNLEDYCPKTKGAYNYSCKVSTIAGKPALQIITENPPLESPSQAGYFVLIEKRNVYTITMPYNSSQERLRSILNQILSTFRFDESFDHEPFGSELRAELLRAEWLTTSKFLDQPQTGQTTPQVLEKDLRMLPIAKP